MPFVLAEQDHIASDMDRLAAQRTAFVYGVSAFPQGEEDATFFGSRMAGQGSARLRRSCDGTAAGGEGEEAVVVGGRARDHDQS